MKSALSDRFFKARSHIVYSWKYCLSLQTQPCKRVVSKQFEFHESKNILAYYFIFIYIIDNWNFLNSLVDLEGRILKRFAFYTKLMPVLNSKWLLNFEQFYIKIKVHDETTVPKYSMQQAPMFNFHRIAKLFTIFFETFL